MSNLGMSALLRFGRSWRQPSVALSMVAAIWLAGWLLAFGLRADNPAVCVIVDLFAYSRASLVCLGVAALLVAWGTAVGFRVVPRLTTALLLTSPSVILPAYFVARASLHYAQGEAKLARGANYGMGGGSLRNYGGIDIPTRIPLRFIPTTCSGLPPQALLEVVVHNGTLRALTTTLGPMKGSYQGRLPSGDELRALLLEQGQCIPADDVSRPFTFAGRSYVLPPALLPSDQRKLHRRSWRVPQTLDRGGSRVVVFEHRLAAFQQCYLDVTNPGCLIEIVDLQTGAVFGTAGFASDDLLEPCVTLSS